MKIVFVNSSLRGKRGLSGRLLGHMVTGAQAEGATCEVIVLAQLKINRCLACDQCQSAGRLGDCVHREGDDVDCIFGKIVAADLVVYATPVYVLGMSSLLKSLFERVYAYAKVRELRLSRSGLFFHDIPENICSKPFASLVCCDNFEDRTTRNCTDFFRSFALFHDAEWRGHIVRNSGQLLTSDVGASMRKQKIFQSFEQAGRELARCGRISRATLSDASREVISLLGFRYLKRLPGVKRAALKKAQGSKNDHP